LESEPNDPAIRAGAGLAENLSVFNFQIDKFTSEMAKHMNRHRLSTKMAAASVEQYLSPERAVETMAMFGARRVLNMPPVHIAMLATYGGALIAAGALFSILLSAGVSTSGPRRLLEEFGFSSGFFFVILSHAILFTEANVVMPVALLHCSPGTLMRRAIRFWIAAWLGNLQALWRLDILSPTFSTTPRRLENVSLKLLKAK
jgi:hypothetical protein